MQIAYFFFFPPPSGHSLVILTGSGSSPCWMRRSLFEFRKELDVRLKVILTCVQTPIVKTDDPITPQIRGILSYRR